METLTVEHTYGQALFDAAKDVGKIGEIGDEFKIVSEIFVETPSLKRLFAVPTLSAVKKKGVAREIFKDKISQELLNFICILIDKRRVGAWDGVGREYENLRMEHDGLTKGIVYTVVPIGQERIKAFEEKYGAALKKTVKLENHIDETLIGGVKIYIDGKLIDASVKSRLEHLKQRITL